MPIKRALRDELRRAVAIYCRASVFDKGRGIKREDQWNIMFEQFHGKGTDTISYGHLLASGQGVFQDMWDFNSENGLSVLKFLYS